MVLSASWNYPRLDAVRRSGERTSPCFTVPVHTVPAEGPSSDLGYHGEIG
ncbi:hypothetical protein ABTY53_12185 [Streptomyces noursei]